MTNLNKEKLNDILNFHILRWEELPEIGLYIDQVAFLLNKHFSLFKDKSEKVITPSMINNYVKIGILAKPENKKYFRNHLATLIIITMLKPTMPLTVIRKGIDIQLSQASAEEAFNAFCITLEQEITKKMQNLFGDNITDEPDGNSLLLEITTAICADKIIAEQIITNQLNNYETTIDENTKKLYKKAEKTEAKFQ